MDQAAAAVIAGSLLSGVPDVDAGVCAAHHRRQEGYLQDSDGFRSRIGGPYHPVCIFIHILIEDLPDVLQHFQFTVAAVLFICLSQLLSGNSGHASTDAQFQDLAQVQPAVGGIAVILSHDQRLLAACHRIIRKIPGLHAVCLKDREEAVVIKEGRGQASRGKEEPSQTLIQFFGCILMQLDRQNRLGQVHVIIGIQKRIGGKIGQILSLHIPAANQQVLGNGPASVRHVEKDQQVLKEGCRTSRLILVFAR